MNKRVLAGRSSILIWLFFTLICLAAVGVGVLIFPLLPASYLYIHYWLGASAVPWILDNQYLINIVSVSGLAGFTLILSVNFVSKKKCGSKNVVQGSSGLTVDSSCSSMSLQLSEEKLDFTEIVQGRIRWNKIGMFSQDKPGMVLFFPNNDWVEIIPSEVFLTARLEESVLVRLNTVSLELGPQHTSVTVEFDGKKRHIPIQVDIVALTMLQRLALVHFDGLLGLAVGSLFGLSLSVFQWISGSALFLMPFVFSLVVGVGCCISFGSIIQDLMNLCVKMAHGILSGFAVGIIFVVLVGVLLKLFSIHYILDF